MRAGGFEINYTDRKLIETELNKDINKFEIGNSVDLMGFRIRENMKKVEDKNTVKVNSSDIRTWLGIGNKLYSKLKKIPTEWDIVREIRESGKSIARCPFSISEWNENHKENKAVNISLNKTNNKQTSNSNTNSSNVSKSQQTKTTNKGTTKGCGDNCPHVGVQGRAPWMKIAIKEMKKYNGLNESQEPLRSKIENEYFPIANYGKQNPTKVAWCAAFITYCMKNSGYENSSVLSVGGYDWGVALRKDHKKEVGLKEKKQKNLLEQ